MASVEKVYTDFRIQGLMAALQSYTLSQPMQLSSLRCFFLNRIFDIQLDPLEIEPTDNGFESFFTRYALLCRLAVNANREIETFSHWQLTEVINYMKKSRECREGFLKEITTNEAFMWEGELRERHVAETLLDLAAGLWSMLSIGRFPGDISYDEPIFWADSRAFDIPGHPDALIEQQFSTRYESEEFVKLPQSFTAAHLEQIGGIEVIWTSNLADHLLLKDDDTKLMLFHQVSILSLHKTSQTSPLPKDLVEETLRSISLLIPPILGERNAWFVQQRKKHNIDAHAGLCDRLNSSQRQIDKFVYWRDRLVLLKRTFDDAEPRNLSQLWLDDRKKTQWFTFWVAVLVFIMTVFFGVIQSVAGIVQAWASVQSLKSQGSPQPAAG